LISSKKGQQSVGWDALLVAPGIKSRAREESTRSCQRVIESVMTSRTK